MVLLLPISARPMWGKPATAVAAVAVLTKLRRLELVVSLIGWSGVVWADTVGFRPFLSRF